MATQRDPSPWPHRIAWVVACATFPLVWVGGLITTTDAGMAVPDWPNTYGYNLLLYPWTTWLFGPWDLFIEHGHRLFATGVGMLTILLLAVSWNQGSRLRMLAAAALALVLTQGVLGGLRVVLNDRYLGLVHGSVGPLFFAYTALLVVLTSSRHTAATFQRRVIWLPLIIFCQVVLGATLRHTPEQSDPWAFATHVQAHLAGALIVTILVFTAAWQGAEDRRARWIGRGMAGLVLLQVGLGVGTWFVKYRLPAWAAGLATGTMDASVAGGWAETHIVTAHTAIGAILLALATARAAMLTREAEPAATTQASLSPSNAQLSP